MSAESQALIPGILRGMLLESFLMFHLRELPACITMELPGILCMREKKETCLLK